jgi:ATP-dependent DNA helicase RecG
MLAYQESSRDHEMTIPEISKADALVLAKLVEDQFFDRKGKAISGKGVQKAAVAFANADGGEIIIGIKDEKEEANPELRWDGVEKPEDFNQHIQSIVELNPTINFRYEYLHCTEYAEYILRIFVDKSREVCVTSDKTVFVRVGVQSLPLKEPQKITQLGFSKGAISYENRKIADLKAEIIVDSVEMARFVDEAKVIPSALSYVLNEGFISNDDWVPLVAGLLLYCDNPQSVFPTRCETRVVFYDTKEDKPEREHLKINETIGGPIYAQINMVIDRISEIMSTISVMTPEGLAKVSYPPEAIWEIVVNAMIHRDYSISDDIQILIFQNRIEILSPGKLPGHVTTRNILDVRDSRNPKIVKGLRRYKNAPNQDLGEGLNTAFDKMKEWRLQPPIFEEVGNYLKVTIGHKPLATPEEAVLKYLDNHEEIRNAIAREITGIRSENQMKEVFYRLRDRNLIEQIPEKKGNASAWRKTTRTDI